MGECVCGLCVCELSAKRGPQMENDEHYNYRLLF